jgi:nicotinamidase-related amidase
MKIRRVLCFVFGFTGMGMGCAMIESQSSNDVVLQTRSRVKESGPKVTEKIQEVRWDASRTAIIICDMWDDHWCKGAARRVVEMAGPMNRCVQAARDRGILVIHAPSSVTAFYKDTPQRRRAQGAPFAKSPTPLSTSKRWGTTWCWPDKTREPGMPIDDSDMGCDCKTKCTIREAWTRQIKTIEIHPDDVITDHGQETFNVLAQRKIDNVILLGVHLNMCVLGRPFGIRQMVHVGKNVVLVRDMTDTMYNSQKKPFVSHFAGTDLVVNHVEQYWCPTILSSDLTGKSPFQFSEASRSRVK